MQKKRTFFFQDLNRPPDHYCSELLDLTAKGISLWEPAAFEKTLGKKNSVLNHLQRGLLMFPCHDAEGSNVTG